MKNKKGFTLVEILVVIGLIGIILLITIPSINAIRRSIKERQLSTKKEILISAAETYAENNQSLFPKEGGIIQIPVRTLVYYGYVDSENCSEAIGCVTNPVNDSSMNDDVITIKKVKSVTQATWDTVDAYLVTFKTNGSSSVGGVTNQVSIGCDTFTNVTCTIKVPTIERDGFEKLGFNTNANATAGAISAGSQLDVNSSNNGTTYYAITKKDVTATFYPNGGSFAGGESSIARSCTIRNTATNCSVASQEPSVEKTGYDKKTGWYTTATSTTTVDISKVANNVSAYAQWSAINYTLTLNLDNGGFSSTPTNYTKVNNTQYTRNYTYETSTFTLPNNPTREGYAFTGWTGSNGTTAQTSVSVATNSTGNKSYTANWNIVNYTVTLNLNNGGFSSTPSGYTKVSNTQYTKGYTYETAAFTLPSNPTREGYSFVGWTGSNGTTAQASVTVSKNSTGNKTYTANWNTTNYTVTLNLNNGSYSSTPSGYTKVSNTQYTKGYTYETDAFTLPNPTRAGYTFAGWTGSNGTTAQTSVSVATNSTGNKSYTANWNIVNYTVTLNLNNGGFSSTPSGYTKVSNTQYTKGYTYETSAFTLPNPTRAGYSFTGWTGSNGTTAQASVTVSKNSTGNKTYTANWNTTNYTVTLNLNNGSYSSTPSGYTKVSNTQYTKGYTYETDAFTLPNPTRAGYTFAGWTGSNVTTAQTSVTVSKNSTGDKTYTANWTAVSSIVTFDVNGGNAWTSSTCGSGYTFTSSGSKCSKSVTYDSTYGNLPSPSRSGYSFAGWYTLASGGTKVETTTSVAITSAQTLYAHWTAYKLTLKYHVNGGTITTGTGTTRWKSNNSFVERSTNSGSTWSVVTSEINTETTECDLWNVGTYGATKTGYKINGTSAYNTSADGTGVDINQDNSSSSTTNAVTVARINGGALTADKTINIYIKWVLETYTVTLNLNSGSYSSTPSGYTKVSDTQYTKGYTYETSAFTLPNPTRAGYSFTGWTGSNGATAQTSVTVSKNSTGDKTYTANWKEDCSQGGTYNSSTGKCEYNASITKTYCGQDAIPNGYSGSCTCIKSETDYASYTACQSACTKGTCSGRKCTITMSIRCGSHANCSDACDPKVATGGGSCTAQYKCGTGTGLTGITLYGTSCLGTTTASSCPSGWGIRTSHGIRGHDYGCNYNTHTLSGTTCSYTP